MKLTQIQKQRLRELNAPGTLYEMSFENSQERDKVYQKTEKKLVEKNKKDLCDLRDRKRRPSLCKLEGDLIDRLTSSGFVQVVTPILLSKGLLERMSITPDHPLSEQIFWLNPNKCLRPMLAPHLYFLLKNLIRLWGDSVRIFEVGPCFRKESKGGQHLEEFTMLNLVETGLPEERRQERIEELTYLIMKSARIESFQFVTASSNVYGETIDIVSDIELGSCAMGPHPLDDAWGIVESWVGLGFGLERLIMTKEKYGNIHRAGRSLVYLDGLRLNI